MSKLEIKFHYLARGIIFVDGKVLLAHQKGAENTFLPGGHIELGEQAGAALVREIEEELGRTAVIRGFIGAVECSWAEKGQANHEIDLLFEVQVPDLDPSQAPASLEPHLEFIWSSPAELEARNLLPGPMIDCLQNWQAGFRGFWGSSF